jgi:hypothetical protein
VAQKLDRWLQLGRAGISPIVLDNYMQGYLGGLGRQGIDLTDAVVHLTNGQPLGMPDPRDVPFLNGLLSQYPRSGQSVNDFYQTADRLRQVEATRQYLRRTLQTEDYIDYAQQHAVALGMGPAFQNASSSMKQLREYRDSVLKDNSLTPSERREKLDAISRQYQNYAEMFAPLMRQINEQEQK